MPKITDDEIFILQDNIDLLRRKLAGEDVLEEEKEWLEKRIETNAKPKSDGGSSDDGKTGISEGSNQDSNSSSQTPPLEPEKPKEETIDETSKDYYIKSPDYEIVKEAIKQRENVFLVGAAGTGKTQMVIEIAKELGVELYIDNAVDDIFTLTGYCDVKGNYHETQFYKWCVNGGIYLLDEADASNPQALVKLNMALSNNYMVFPEIGKVMLNEKCRCVATGNTWGDGASMEYVGRNQLDSATLDRFDMYFVDYNTFVERKICPDADLRAFIQDYRKAIYACGIKQVVSYRAMTGIKNLLKTKIPLETIIEMRLTRGLEKDDLTNVFNQMHLVDNIYYKALHNLCS